MLVRRVVRYGMNLQRMYTITLFTGLPWLQFLIAYKIHFYILQAIKNWSRRRPGTRLIHDHVILIAKLICISAVSGHHAEVSGLREFSEGIPLVKRSFTEEALGRDIISTL